MSDIWKIRLVAAFFIPIGLFGPIFVGPTEGHTPRGVLFVKLFVPTGAFWIFRITCVGIIMLPIGAIGCTWAASAALTLISNANQCWNPNPKRQLDANSERSTFFQRGSPTMSYPVTSTIWMGLGILRSSLMKRQPRYFIGNDGSRAKCTICSKPCSGHTHRSDGLYRLSGRR